MTTPQQVLSDEQIEEIDNAHNWQTTAGRAAAYRAIESATLKAVSGQEPVRDDIGKEFYELSGAAWGIAPAWGSLNQDERDRQRSAAKQFLSRCTLPPAQPAPVDDEVIAGVLFDFMGWLTSRKQRIVLSSSDNASPAVDAIEEFAKMRGIDISNAAVLDWQARAALQCAQAPQATKGGEA